MPRTGLGGFLTLGAIGAAIVSHLTVLGIEIQGDGGLLFAMAWTTFLCAAIATFLHRREFPGRVSLSMRFPLAFASAVMKDAMAAPFRNFMEVETNLLHSMAKAGF
jgi:hypothetical protein